MNTLSTTSMSDPYGKIAECIQFTIDDTTDPFLLNDIMSIDRQYTFSLWLMSTIAETISDGNTIEGSLSVGGTRFVSNNTWNRYAVTFKADNTDLAFNFGVAGTYYIYHPQLEIGNKVTDWAPAPEDQSDEMETRFTVEAGKIEAQFTSVNNAINDLGETIKEQYTKNITSTEKGISITDSNGVYEIQLDNIEGVTIRKNGEIRSQLVDDDFYTGNIVVKVEERAQLGNFAFVPRSDGSLSFLKVGG